MKRAIKRVAIASLILTLFLIALLSPGLPWSARMRQNFMRMVVKAEAKVARLQGEHPREVLLQGRLSGSGAQVEMLKGARVFALESASGYSALTDSEGRFLLPHITFYPGAVYTLIVLIDLQNARQFKVTAPLVADDIVSVGEIVFNNGSDISYINTPVRYMRHDIENDRYYRDIFDSLTADFQADEQKIDAICRYVATKLNQKEEKKKFSSPREVIEQGASLCSDLALAMAAITEAGNYPTRTVHTSDSAEHRNTHVLVEVYYKDRWHLYDPTYGVNFLNNKGGVASYKELRLNPDLITAEAFRGFKAKTVRSILDWMVGTYRSGFHQIYQVNRDDLCVVW
jgi:hypothetical protein